MGTRKKNYSLIGFIFDLILICFTGGAWLLWIFVREMRNR